MTVTDIIDRIHIAQRQQEAAVDELELTRGHWETSAAGRAYAAAVEAELDAIRELTMARATNKTEALMKASILVHYTHGPNGKNLGEPLYEDELPALYASIQRDRKALGVRVV